MEELAAYLDQAPFRRLDQSISPSTTTKLAVTVALGCFVKALELSTTRHYPDAFGFPHGRGLHRW